jgi:hypothetical protein
MDKQLIQRLAREAGFLIDGAGNAFSAPHPELLHDAPVQKQLERFATLLAQECAMRATTASVGEGLAKLAQERLQYVCDIPGKFLDMTEHAGRLIILTESGVFELRPGETALRQPQPMTPQDATELDKHNQLVGVTNDEGQWRYTTYPVQFKKED